MLKDTIGYKLCEQIIALKGNENKLFKKILDVNGVKRLVVELNTTIQFGQEHVDSNGNPLTNAYSGSTTYSLFDPQGRGGKDYTLFDTGDYWDSFKVSVHEGYILIESNPIKENDNLYEMFGTDIEGLTDESLQALIDKVIELYLDYFRNGIAQRNLD